MITLKPHSISDIKYRVKWFNNPVVDKFIGDCSGQKTTLKKEKEWFKNYQKAKDKKFFKIFVDKKPIGLVGLSRIDKKNKNAELFIAIGEDNYRGKGFGKAALLWIVDFAFKRLKLHKINLGVVKENVPAVNLYKKIGFQVEGVKKDEMFFDNKYHDLFLTAIFKKIVF